MNNQNPRRKNIQFTTQMLPEWAHQSAIIIAWPHVDTDWKTILPKIEYTYLKIVTAITNTRQDLLILCRNNEHKTHIGALLSAHAIDKNHIRFAQVAFNDTWVRDYGPLSIRKNNHLVLVDFHFNGWGEKYSANFDNVVNTRLVEKRVLGETDLRRYDFVLEGGSIDTDGCGSLLMTTRSLLSSNRNPGIDQDECETRLRKILGCTRFLWLKHGFLAGDDTDGHIDNLARFCNPQTIAYSSCIHTTDEHFTELEAMKSELNKFRDTEGQPYELVPLPIPPPIYSDHGQRLPASYANFLIANNILLVPQFNAPQDKIALERLQEVFNTRDALGIDCNTLIQQYGGLHCMTMQLPR